MRIAKSKIRKFRKVVDKQEHLFYYLNKSYAVGQGMKIKKETDTYE